MNDFNPETALIGGMSVISIHLVIMAQLRKFTPDMPYLDKFFDLFNYPVAFILMLLLQPPWPVFSWLAWQEYVQYSIALAALASISATKVLGQDKKVIQEMEVEQALQTTPPNNGSGATVRPLITKERQ